MYFHGTFHGGTLMTMHLFGLLFIYTARSQACVWLCRVHFHLHSTLHPWTVLSLCIPCFSYCPSSFCLRYRVKCASTHVPYSTFSRRWVLNSVTERQTLEDSWVGIGFAVEILLFRVTRESQRRVFGGYCHVFQSTFIRTRSGLWLIGHGLGRYRQTLSFSVSLDGTWL